jgi:hypothetical protein
MNCHIAGKIGINKSQTALEAFVQLPFEQRLNAL